MSTEPLYREASRPPDFNAPCPNCGPHRRDPANRKRKVLGVWKQADGSEVSWCIRCGYGERDALAYQPPSEYRSNRTSEARSQLAAALWARRIPIGQTPAETYLREGRGLSCALPATLGYLPAYKDYPHVVISAFGICQEPEPGRLSPPDIVTAVHLTELTSDGRSRTGKRMLGPVSDQPIMLAPPNDMLGLVLTEGIEDALSLHQVTGLGAWAGGSAGHMAKLGSVVPDYIDCVTIAEDLNEAGRKATGALASQLRSRGIEVRVFRPFG
jgi:hypothetical protein